MAFLLYDSYTPLGGCTPSIPTQQYSILVVTFHIKLAVPHPYTMISDLLYYSIGHQNGNSLFQHCTAPQNGKYSTAVLQYVCFPHQICNVPFQLCSFVYQGCNNF
ncbi:Hypothetical predicted protein [Octopus vulgaris]|uniref:Uncharacterized protein n=1 Tax=Octopus vulgaris TaxID=6645 RepID=A0AA36ARN5_OCTVU|nr:Hypothetical predicted protein [Octopus vulgaris]